MKTSIVLVTPAIAASMLSVPGRNRGLIRSSVELFERALRDGRFLLTHQGVAIGLDGAVIDGQHRLMAIANTGIAARLMVSTGVPAAATEAIDVGIGRRAQDVLRITDGVEVSVELRACVLLADRIVLREPTAGCRRVTADGLRSAIARHANDAEPVIRVLGRRHDHMRPAALSGALAVLHAIDPVRTERFANDVRDGVDLPARAPALALRTFILTRARGVRRELTGCAFEAFEAFCEGGLRRWIRRDSIAAQERAVVRWHAAKAA